MGPTLRPHPPLYKDQAVIRLDLAYQLEGRDHDGVGWGLTMD